MKNYFKTEKVIEIFIAKSYLSVNFYIGVFHAEILPTYHFFLRLNGIFGKVCGQF